MKMRIQGNAIRFRLNRPEVAEFERSGKASAFVEFPGGGRLTYSLVRGNAAKSSAAFEDGEVRIEIPEARSREWCGTNQVGITERAAVGEGGELEIIIEKDFQCMHKGDGAKNPDAYPNPIAAESA